MFKSKNISFILILVLLLTFLTACSGGPDDSKTAVGDKDGASEEVKDGDKQDSGEVEEVTVDEQVLLEQDDIKITLKSIEYDGLFGPSLQVLVENNSSEAVTIQTRNSSINGVMIEALFSCDVVPGKKANDEITFMDSNLEYADIRTIQEIEFIFHVFDSDTYDGIFDSNTIMVKTSADSSYVQEYDDSGVEVMNEDGIRIVMKKVNTSDSFWGADVYVYIENNSDTDVTIQTRDVSINGFMVDPIFSSDIVAGKKTYDTITFMESDLEDNDISSIDDIELSFHIFESDGWNTILDTPLIEVSFE